MDLALALNQLQPRSAVVPESLETLSETITHELERLRGCPSFSRKRCSTPFEQ